MGSLPPIFIEFLGKKTGFSATAAGVRTELAEVETAGGGSMARLGAVGKAALLGIGVAAGVAAVKTVHMAADFQTQMTRVQTGAGELASNMSLVSHGVLTMAGQVGQSTHELTSGLYMVESAGYHGADALNVLRISAEGAKVGAADMASVTDAVTTALNAYKMSASETTHVMNALVGTEAEGKTNMEALASSMSSILPVAASAHVGLYEVLGAMATMTSQGTSAKVAATYLRQTIGQLSNPTAKAANEMRSLGLNSTHVATELGSKGLAATLTTLTDAIEKHMGPAGTVLINKLRAASHHTTEFQKVLANLPPTQQTYIGALATMVGGTKSMMAALQLTGPHMETFRKNVDGISKHVKDGGNSVEGWSEVQGTFNQKMAEAKGEAQAFGIEIGIVLLPAATKFMVVLGKLAALAVQHRTAFMLMSAGFLAVALGLAVATIASWDFNESLLADPLTWIVVGIVALVVALVELVLHWKAVAAWLGSVWHATISGLVAAWHWLASETSNVWNNYIVAPIKAAWNALARSTVHGYHQVIDPIVAAWRAVSSATATIWNAIVGFFRKWWPLLLVIFFPYIALLISAWNHFHKTLFGAARIAWAAIVLLFTTVWNDLAAGAKTIWNLISKFIITPIVLVGKELEKAWKATEKFLSSQWHTIRGGASAGWGAIRKAIIDPAAQAYNAVKKRMDSIRKSVSAALNGAYKDVKGIGSKFFNVGKAIIEGMVAGTKAMAGQLASEVKKAANDALKGAKSFLGINSPSRRARDEIGRWIPAGVAEGVSKYAHLAHEAMRRMSGGLMVAGAPGVASFGPNAMSLGSSGGGTVVHNHVHVEVKGTVMAERDLGNAIQTVMTQIGSRNSSTYTPYKR